MGYDSYLSWTSKKHQKTLLRPLHSKLKKIKDFSRTSPKIQRPFKTVQTLIKGRDRKTRYGILGG